MKLTQTQIWIGTGVISLLAVSLIAAGTGKKASVAPSENIVEALAEQQAPTEDSPTEPRLEKLGGKTLRTAPEKEITTGIDKAKVRIVMVGTKNCSIPGTKQVCTEIPVYTNARPNNQELVATIPNGRKVMIIESAGEWSHVAIFTVNGTELTEKTGWTLTSWLTTVK